MGLVSFGIKTRLLDSSSPPPSLPQQPNADDFNDGPLGTDIGGKQFNEYEMDPLDAYPTGMEDEEVLEAMRNERRVSNDLWQSTSFRDTQCGEWSGSYELYEIKTGDGGMNLGLADRGTCEAGMTAGTFEPKGVSIFVKEKYLSQNSEGYSSVASELLLKATKEEYTSEEWRTAEGNQVVGNTFTLNRVDPVLPLRNHEDWDPVTPIEASTLSYPPDTYVSELGVKDGPVRTRVRYAFQKVPIKVLGGNNNGNVNGAVPISLSQGELDGGAYAMQCVGLLIVREGLKGSTPQEMQPLMDASTGPGIYDPQEEGEPYVQLNMPGRLSLLFPRGLPANGRAVLTIEFQGTTMRYQADRKFVNLSGAIKTLELTEIRSSDVENYPPPFVEVDLLK